MLVLLLTTVTSSPVLADDGADQRDFLQQKLLPLLQARCLECHGGREEIKGGLLITGRDTLLRGGDSGPSIVPGRPDESLLVEAIRYESLEMPPRSKMPEAEINIFVEWIQMGAPWPDDLKITDAAPAAADEFPLEQRRSSHWAWQPLQDPPVPAVHGSEWAADPIDHFVLSKLESAGLAPAADATRPVLIRRLYFDLIGLPPTPDDVQSFVNDPADDAAAIGSVVDRLLASPQFGERWGRHWLDLVRYAETLGHEFDYPLRHAWQYRDYIIRALNADVPYDDLIREHVAGDLLKHPRRHPTEQYNESLIATGFWFLHEDKHAPVDVEYEEAVKVDNQIDVFTRSFLGLTVACARCHDHKFDAISTQDYYALFGILQSSRRRTGWLDPQRKIEQASQQLSALRTKAADLQKELKDQDIRDASLLKYASAVQQVFRSKAGETPSPDVPGAKRDVTATATEAGVDPVVLTRWAQQLGSEGAANVSHPLSLLARLTESDRDPVDVSGQWLQEVEAALTDDDTELYADFGDGLPAGWLKTGPAFSSLPRVPLAPAGPRYRRSDSGFSSADLSRKLRGSVSSPTFEITYPEVLIRIAGEGARARVVIDGYVMMEFNALLFSGIDTKIDTKGEFKWIRLSGDLHRYQGKHAYIEIMDEGDGWFVVDQIRFAQQRGASEPKQNIPASSRRLAERLRRNPDAPAVPPLVEESWSYLLESGLTPGSDSSKWKQLQADWLAVADTIPAPLPVLAVTEGTGEDQHIFVRGNHRTPGRIAPRAFLTALAGDHQPPVTEGSGRRELVERLLNKDNPLPARVAVNRVWHHLFGRGIVSSTDDFGVLGARPSHPQLLDHLATGFRQDGWSLKRLIRRLVLTRTWRMSSTPSDAARDTDPANRLFHSARVRRLQGEVIRDTLLKLSGRLDLKQFGPPIPVALTSFMEGRGRPKKSGPIDGDGRRSIYISVNRNFLSPFMLAFDTPAPMSTRGRRSVSNVPAQALIMLNDEFAHQQAALWAKRLQNPATSVQNQLTTAWEEAFGRAPSDEEMKTLQQFTASQAVVHDEPLSENAIGAKTLQDICHALMNAKEFIYIR